MTDKDVERNVRSTTVEGIKTPTERHIHGIGEKHAISFGEKSEATRKKQSLLEKFRHREKMRKAKSEGKPSGGEAGGAGESPAGELEKE